MISGYNASTMTHELPGKARSAIHNRRIKSPSLQPGDRRLIIKTRRASAFFRLRVTPVTSARRYRASSVINVKTVSAAIALPSRVSVLLSLSLLRVHDAVRKPEARKNRDNRRNCGKSTRGSALSLRTQWYRRIREIRDERITPYETGRHSSTSLVHGTYIDLCESGLNSQERFVALELSDTRHIL